MNNERMPKTLTDAQRLVADMYRAEENDNARLIKHIDRTRPHGVLVTEAIGIVTRQLAALRTVEAAGIEYTVQLQELPE